MALYYLTLTSHGAAALAAAQAGGAGIQITDLVLGDANGQPYQPDSAVSRTALVHECARLPVISVTADEDRVIVETLIPPETGGFAIHEIGLTDATGQLLYIGNWTGSYKPVLAEGGAGDMQLTIELMTSGLPTVIIPMDPSNITATRQWALDRFVLQTVHAAHVTQNALEHDNLLELINTLNQLIADQAEELMSTQFSILQQAIADLTNRVAAIESQPAIQPIKVGGLLITTIAYADAAAVAAGEGYGVWMRYAEGRALVGLSDNTGDPTWTKSIGGTAGEYEHILTIDEIPEHQHGQRADSDGGANQPQVTNSSGGVDGLRGQTDPASTGKTQVMTDSAGGGQAISLLQPSITVAIWRRTA